MKTILIVDDSDYKVVDIAEALRDLFPDVNIRVANAFNPAVQAIIECKPVLIVLDMSIPTFAPGARDLGGRMRPFGGRDILRELQDLEIPSKVIVITQFDRFGESGGTKFREQLMDELRLEFPSHFVAGLYYDVTGGSWKDQLKDCIRLLAFAQ